MVSLVLSSSFVQNKDSIFFMRNNECYSYRDEGETDNNREIKRKRARQKLTDIQGQLQLLKAQIALEHSR